MPTKREIGTICFFYPATEVGGAEILFFRYFSFLKKNKVKVKFIVTSREEIYFKWIKNHDDILFLDEVSEEIKKNTLTIITPPTLCFDRKYLTKFMGCKLIIWSLHPGLLTQSIKGKYHFFNRLLLKKLLTKIHTKNALWFLDASCFAHSKSKAHLSFTPIIKHLLIDKENDLQPKKKEKIAIAFVQRIVEEKIGQVIYILNYLKSRTIEEKQKIEIHIIGDGVVKHLFTDFEKEFPNFYFHGFIDRENLIPFLNEKIDVTFAMGQTVLDACLAANLSVILDLMPINLSLNSLKFDFIYQIKEISLGDFYNEKINQSKTNTIEEIINIIYNDDLLSQEKKKCLEFAYHNFIFNQEKLDTFIEDVDKSAYFINKKTIKELTSITLPTYLTNF